MVALDRLEEFFGDAAVILLALGDVLHGSDSFVIATSVNEKFWCLLEREYEKSHEENEEGNGAGGEEKVAPTHVA